MVANTIAGHLSISGSSLSSFGPHPQPAAQTDKENEAMIVLKLIVMMTITCWTPTKGGALKEAWSFEMPVPLDQCLAMNGAFATAGPKGAITVKCKRIDNNGSWM